MSALVNFVILGLAGASMVAADGFDADAPAEGACVTLAEAASSAGNLNRLGEAVLSLVQEDGAETLALLATTAIPIPDEQKVTIFAPEDAAWPDAAELPSGNALLEVLLGHVVEAYLPSDAVIEALAANDQVPLPTSAGTEITATMEGEEIFVAAPMQVPPGSMVVQTDIETCVGVIHVIDALLVAGEEALAPGPASLLGPVMAPLEAPIGAGPIAFAPSALAPPGVAPAPGGDLPGGAPAPADAFAPVGTDSGADTTTSRDGGVVGTDEDTDAAAHLLAGTVVSVAAAAFALLA